VCLQVDGLLEEPSAVLTTQYELVEYFHTIGRKVEGVTSLSIKNKETYRLVHELADLTGESMTTAVTLAVQERLDRIRCEQDTGLVERIMAIVEDAAPRFKEPFQSTDIDELLYDEFGLPK
jgi:antitoxin VapB